MPKSRRIFRPASRSAVRRSIRVCWRAPDDLGTALTSFTRALRSHRRLARLAPRFFDSTVVERERREREAHRRWMEECEAALTKVYGPSPNPPPPTPDLPPLPPPRTCLMVEAELVPLIAWFNAGSHALRRLRLRRPRGLINFYRLARMIEIASDLGRLATGVDSNQPQTEPRFTRAIALADPPPRFR